MLPLHDFLSLQSHLQLFPTDCYFTCNNRTIRLTEVQNNRKPLKQISQLPKRPISSILSFPSAKRPFQAQPQPQLPFRSFLSPVTPSNRRKSTSDDNYIQQLTTIMEFLQFGEDSQDQPQSTKESPLLHHPLQPCRFIEDLNKKQNVCYPFIDDENLYIKLYENFRVKSLDDRTLEDEPVMNKIQSFDEKLMGKKEGENLDPEQQVGKLKPNMRKRITIEKKLSEHAPLNGPGVIKLKDGKVVFGTWKDGQPIGQVKIMYPSGNIYIGEVKNYIRDGKGLFCYNNGYKYDGQFKNGKFQGYGEITNEFGEVVSKGIWAGGQLAQSII